MGEHPSSKSSHSFLIQNATKSSCGNQGSGIRKIKEVLPMRSHKLMERGGPFPLGSVLSQDVLGADGRVALGKGSVLSEVEVARLRTLPWSELHLIEMEQGDLHEDEAGRRLARAAAGEGVVVQPQAAGALPLAARQRRLLQIDPADLARVYEVDELALV